MLSGNLLSSRGQFSEIAILHSLFAGADEVIEQFELFAAVHESVTGTSPTWPVCRTSALRHNRPFAQFATAFLSSAEIDFCNRIRPEAVTPSICARRRCRGSPVFVGQQFDRLLVTSA